VALKIADELFSKKENINTMSLKVKNGIKKITYTSIRVRECVSRPWKRVGKERWLIIEKLIDGSLKYYISNYSISFSPK
jgi:hypothetical protein